MHDHIKNLSGGSADIQSKQDVVDFLARIKKTARKQEIPGDPEKTNRLYGVTICYKKEDVPELTKAGTMGPQKRWEQRIYSPDGISIQNAHMIFAPQERIDDVKGILSNAGMEHLEVRPSEELEILRLTHEADKTL